MIRFAVPEFQLEVIQVLPFRKSAADDPAMTGPEIISEVGHGSYDFRTQGVQVDVPNGIPEIGRFSDYGGFVAILKEVPYATVPLVKIHGVSSHQALHERRKVPLVTP